MIDKETKEILSDADHVRNMVNSQGWGYVKGKLDDLILDLQNINNLDMTNVDSLNAQIAARKMAVDVIFGWLKLHVYGFVEQQEANNQPLPTQPENFIERE
jgi:hypothetical protein